METTSSQVDLFRLAAMRGADQSTTAASVATHGAACLPEVMVDSYIVELKDDEGLLGDRATLIAAYMLLGSIRISEGRSGRAVPRFHAFERFVHWLTAVSFVILGLTGLNMTFGKKLLMPLLGQDAFSAFSEWAKYAHDFMSFPFVTGIVLMAALWLKDNIPEEIDLEWFRQGGGFIRSKQRGRLTWPADWLGAIAVPHFAHLNCDAPRADQTTGVVDHRHRRCN